MIGNKGQMSKEPSIKKAAKIFGVWKLGILWAFALCPWSFAADKPAPKTQYSYADITVPLPRADEPRREKVSITLAENYLRDGARAWVGTKDCITCHTTGLYLQVRPALTRQLGPPLPEMRDFFVTQLREMKSLPEAKQQAGIKPAQFIYAAAGLAEWDAHVTRKLSPETLAALAAMFALQRTNGTWGSLDCWPPYESDAYHLATVAAMAAGTSPGWLRHVEAGRRASVERLKD